MKCDMAETISHTWQTVEQAAVTLNVSTRTVARRLASGSLESRVDENGRRLVLVQQIGEAAGDEPAATDVPGSDETALYVPTEASTQATVVQSSQAVTMLNVLQSTVNSAREDAYAARRSAKWAWTGVAFMALAIVGGVGFLSSVMTKSSVTSTMLREQLADKKTELDQARAELIATRTAEALATRDLSGAKKTIDDQRQQLATATAAKTTPETKVVATTSATPATQPATLLGRLVSALGD